MAGDTPITVVGSLGADPELRFTQAGKAVASFNVASTPRQFDKNKNEWVDGETLWLKCTVWGEYAENCAETLTKGMRVVVVGRLRQESWEKDGEKRTAMVVDVDEVGPSLRYATAKVTRMEKKTQQPAAASSRGSADPWSDNGPGF